MKRVIKVVLYYWSVLIVDVWYGDIWKLKDQLFNDTSNYGLKKRLYNDYLIHFGSFIGIGSKIGKNLTFPHGMLGIFISTNAIIGDDVVIFQHVTIGSNQIKGSKGYGAPQIGNGVLIGAGAKIIGNVKIGDYARIGSNCVVVNDVPPYTTCVMSKPRLVFRDVK